MNKKYFKNLITSILIVVFVSTPYFYYVSKVSALTITSQKGINIGSIKQCKDVGLATRLLFTTTVGALSAGLDGNSMEYSLGTGVGEALGTEAVNYATEAVNKGLDDIIPGGGDDSVKVEISGESKKTIDGINKKVTETNKNVEIIKDTSTCTAAVGRMVTKMLLQKLTIATVNWIKSGFEGNPAFIQNPGKFFKDIAKNELLQFSSEITATNSPFGKEWLKNTARAFNNKFQDNAKYSLDKMIQNTNPEYSASTFKMDFSNGGWDAWSAMTQVPANNPLGFKIMADTELEKRLAGTVQSTAEKYQEALRQANGFLGDERCADPKGVTKEEHEKGLIERTKYPNINKNDPLSHVYENNICNRWEYVTPGKLISDAATSTMTTTKDSLLVADDLNDAIASITDALLAQFSSDLIENGFAETTTEDYFGTISYEEIDNEPQTIKDFSQIHLSSSWLSENPNFNIRTDITQALIDEQRTYSDKLAQQNKELNSTTDGKPYALSADKKSSNAYGLIPVIYQLDYCIPGPHPGWEKDARDKLTEIFSNSSTNISSESSDSSFGAGLINGAISSIPFVGGLIGALMADNAGEQTYEARKEYGNIFYDLTGFRLRIRESLDKLSMQDSRLTSKDGMIYITNQILQRYIEIMKKTYFSLEMLPPIAKEASVSFKQLPGYLNLIKDNEDKINLLKPTIITLKDIKKNISDLNTEYKNEKGEFKPGKPEEEYEDKLKKEISAFGRISVNMVNGNDIASADNLLKEIVDKKNYLYKDLLKGPYGCEKFLEDLDTSAVSYKNFPSAGAVVGETEWNWSKFNVNSIQRPTYPFPILYDYNSFPVEGTLLPDPLNKTQIYNNKTPINKWKDRALSSGFLTFVHFTRNDNNATAHKGPERLQINDLVDTYGDETIEYSHIPLTKFEHAIGIY